MKMHLKIYKLSLQDALWSLLLFYIELSKANKPLYSLIQLGVEGSAVVIGTGNGLPLVWRWYPDSRNTCSRILRRLKLD